MRRLGSILRCCKTFPITTLACMLLAFYYAGGYVRIQRLFASFVTDKSSSNSETRWPHRPACEDEISTTRDTRYVLYGDGPSDHHINGRLYHYIRALTSRRTPGPRRLQHGSAQFSQIGASEFVDQLLKGRRDGVFIECGAADGERLSNSLFFELRRNWTGVLIEPNPNFHRALLSKNRNAYVVRACLSTTARPQTVKYRLMDFVSGIADRLAVSAPGTPVIDVQCFPLNSIAAALGVRYVDYLSLDVEGPELDILRTVDWSRLSVDVMTVEYGRNVGKLGLLRSLFNATGTFVEVALLPLSSTDDSGQDVVFMRAALRNESVPGV